MKRCLGVVGMRICWDNLEGLYLSRRGNLRKGSVTFIEVDKCNGCGETYLARKSCFEKKGVERFCDHACHSISRCGTHHTEESKIKISNGNKGKASPMLGKRHKKETRKKMSLRQLGEKHHNYKGGVTESNIPLFDTYTKRLDYAEKTRYIYEHGLKVLQVKCSKCEGGFTPTTASVQRRVYVLEGKKAGACRFYCSDMCKAACPIFGQQKYPRGHKQTKLYTDKELKGWRNEVFKRADYKCEYCGQVATDAHHERPKKLEPFFVLDPDNGIACCKECHNKYGHKNDCSTGALASIICAGGNNIVEGR